MALDKCSELFVQSQSGGMFALSDFLHHGGNVFFVHSGRGTNAAGNGKNPSLPFATIDYAIGQCTASQDDVIVVLPGHAETIAGAAGINADVAGVRIIGVGEGTLRPTLTLSAVASTIALAAASCSLENFLLKAEHDVTIMLDVNAAECKVRKCEFRSRTAATAREFVTAIDVNGGAANACDDTVIEDCQFWSPTAGANNCIELGEVAARVRISRCKAWGDYADAPIHNPTGKVLTQLLIEDSYLENTQTGDHSIELVSACTGMLVRNLYKNDMVQATGVDPGSCASFECYHDDTIDVSGIITPVIT